MFGHLYFCIITFLPYHTVTCRLLLVIWWTRDTVLVTYHLAGISHIPNWLSVTSAALTATFPISLVFLTYWTLLFQCSLHVIPLIIPAALLSVCYTQRWSFLDIARNVAHLLQIRSQPRCTQLNSLPTTGNMSPDVFLDPMVSSQQTRDKVEPTYPHIGLSPSKSPTVENSVVAP